MSNNYRYNINNNSNSIDLYLVGNPQITYFKSVYRKHTSFIIETSSYPIILETTKFSLSNVESLLSGDLLKNISLYVNYTVNFATRKSASLVQGNIITDILTDISYSISGLGEVEKLTGEYIEIYNQLRLPLTTSSIYERGPNNRDVKIGNSFNIMSHSGGVFYDDSYIDINSSYTSILPIPFSFSHNIGNALPLLLLRNNQNSLTISSNFKSPTDSGVTINNLKIILEEIKFTDSNDISRFSLVDNEYIYNRVYPITNKDDSYVKIPTSENYGNIKSMIWKSPQNNNYNISINTQSLFTSTSSKLNSRYFTKYFPMKAGLLGTSREFNSNGSYIISNNDIHYYTFGLKDNLNKEYVPNGSINSNVNDVELSFDGSSSNVNSIYIVTYHIINFRVTGPPIFLNPVKTFVTS